MSKYYEDVEKAIELFNKDPEFLKDVFKKSNLQLNEVFSKEEIINSVRENSSIEDIFSRNQMRDFVIEYLESNL